MNVLILSGSVGKQSCTRTLLQYIGQLLQTKGVQVTFWDLTTKPLPIALPEYHMRQAEHPKTIVRKFVRAVDEADAFVLGSPLYHDSFSGVLKNALDNLPNYAFRSKPVGLVSHSSNVRSCITPCAQLRPVVRSLGGYPAQVQIGTTDIDYKKVNGQLMVHDSKIKRRATRLVNELIKLSAQLQS